MIHAHKNLCWNNTNESFNVGFCTELIRKALKKMPILDLPCPSVMLLFRPASTFLNISRTNRRNETNYVYTISLKSATLGL